MQNNSQGEQTWGMLCHVSAFAWVLLTLIGLPIPFLVANIIGPLIVWSMKKNESEFVNAHGRESVNFQITTTITGLILVTLLVVLGFVLITTGIVAAGGDGNIGNFLLGGIGLLGLIIIAVAIGIYQTALVIFAALKAKQGQMYRYPMTIRFL